jgi:hypothetical protein
MVYLSRGALVAFTLLLTNISPGHAAIVRSLGPQLEPGTQVVPSPAPLHDSVAARRMDDDHVKRGNADQIDRKADADIQARRSVSKAEDVSESTASSKNLRRQDDASSKPYLVNTVDGATQEAYDEFAAQPPLAGKKGDMVSFPSSPWISYQYLNLTDAEAAEVRKNPIIFSADPITEDDGAALVIPQHDYTTTMLGKRALPQSLNQRDESAYHLGLISARNQKNDPTKLPNYVFQPSLGKGQTIYVLDSGYLKSHQEFDASNREVRDFCVESAYTLNPFLVGRTPPGVNPDDLKAPDNMDDVLPGGHGTLVASVAAGSSKGVASLANLVVVKFRNAAKNPYNPSNPNFLPRGVSDSALQRAFFWVFQDVREQRQKNPDPFAQYIVNLSYGKYCTVHQFPEGLQLTQSLGWIRQDHPGKEGMLQRLLLACKDMDITLVVAAGNEGRQRTLDTLVPQVYGTDNRFSMITVGGVDKEGKYYADTVQGNGQGGAVDIYAGAVDVSAASPAEGGTSYTTAPGTSLAAPAVVRPPPSF